MPVTIINADASQVYRDLRVLSARPSESEEAQCHHRLFGYIDGAESCSAARWAEDAKDAIEQSIGEGRLPVLVGGTGLYIRTLLTGIAPVPEISPKIRDLVRSLDVTSAYDALRWEDPEAAVRLAPTDTTRVARALEVVRATGRTLKEWQAELIGGIADQISLNALLLLPPREWLVERCQKRLIAMFDDGGLEEVEQLVARRLSPMLPVMRAIGVGEISAWLCGEISREQALEATNIATRQYAKRQSTWFRNQSPIGWKRVELLLSDDKFDEFVIKFQQSLLT